MDQNWNGFFAPVLLTGCLLAVLVSFHIFYIEKDYEVIVTIPCAEEGYPCDPGLSEGIEKRVSARELLP